MKHEPITLTVTTEQEAFTAVKTHLLAMTERAMSPIGSPGSHCQYRVDQNPKGNRCAIGALIRDEDYYPDLDTGAIAGGKHVKSLTIDGTIITSIDPYLLLDLQKVHDEAENWEGNVLIGPVTLSPRGVGRLMFLADHYGLQYEVA